MSNAEFQPRKFAMSPDGTVTELPPPTPEELAELQRTFLEKYDPETMERRSIQKLRSKQGRTSLPSPKSGQ